MSETIKVECVQSLADKELYRYGKEYDLPRSFASRFPEHFKPVGWREKQKLAKLEAQKQQVESETAATVQRYETFRQEIERKEAQATLMLAEQDRMRARQIEEAAAAAEAEANRKLESLPPEPPPAPAVAAPPMLQESPAEPPVRHGDRVPEGPPARAERLKKDR